MKKTDLRVLRSRKMILDAFVSLIAEKDYDKITVQEIADRAMVNRATFYAHFKDKTDLYDATFQAAIASFFGDFPPNYVLIENKIDVKQIELLFTSIYETIHKNKKFFLTIMKTSGIDPLHNAVVEKIMTEYPGILQQIRITADPIEVPLELIIEYILSIFIGTIRWWVRSDSSMPPSELAKLTIKLVRNGHFKIMGIEIIDVE